MLSQLTTLTVGVLNVVYLLLYSWFLKLSEQANTHHCRAWNNYYRNYLAIHSKEELQVCPTKLDHGWNAEVSEKMANCYCMYFKSHQHVLCLLSQTQNDVLHICVDFAYIDTVVLILECWLLHGTQWCPVMYSIYLVHKHMALSLRWIWRWHWSYDVH